MVDLGANADPFADLVVVVRRHVRQQQLAAGQAQRVQEFRAAEGLAFDARLHRAQVVVHYARTEEFIALYDNPAFDPKGETLPISEFEPMVRRLFAQPRNTIYKAALEERPAA